MFKGTSATTRALGVVVAVLVALIGLGAPPASAVGNYNNANIADRALSYVGQWGGQCRAFVNKVISEGGVAIKS